MNFKSLSKLMAGIIVASCLLAPVQSKAATITTTNATTTTFSATTASTQVVKLSSITATGIVAYIHNGDNYWGTTYSVCSYSADIIVQNKSYDKTIVLHYIDADGIWEDSNKATYVKTNSDGTEVWNIKGYFGGNAIFAVNYKEANAWDNNNTLNYRLFNS